MHTIVCMALGNEEGVLDWVRISVSCWRGVSSGRKWKGDWTFLCFVQNGPILLRCVSSSTPVLLNIYFFIITTPLPPKGALLDFFPNCPPHYEIFILSGCVLWLFGGTNHYHIRHRSAFQELLFPSWGHCCPLERACPTLAT